EALIAFAVDVRGAGVQRDRGDLAQRNVGIDTAGGLQADLDGADPVHAIAVRGRDPGDHGELALTFEYRSRLCPAERRLDDAVDIARIEAIPGRLVASHRDIQVRLPEDAEDAEIGNPFDLGHDGQDLRSELFERCQVAPGDLDRVGALDARQLLLD